MSLTIVRVTCFFSFDNAVLGDLAPLWNDLFLSAQGKLLLVRFQLLKSNLDLASSSALSVEYEAGAPMAIEEVAALTGVMWAILRRTIAVVCVCLNLTDTACAA
jgi:hypothetical protein